MTGHAAVQRPCHGRPRGPRVIAWRPRSSENTPRTKPLETALPSTERSSLLQVCASGGIVDLLSAVDRMEDAMEMRIATCRCGQLQAICKGGPVRVSICHCLDCQKRSGSAFAAQARWPEAQVMVSGRAKTWERIAATAATRQRISSVLIAALRSHTSSKAGRAWWRCLSAPSPIQIFPRQSSQSTSIESTPGSQYWAKM
jgi:hypothetical protein